MLLIGHKSRPIFDRYHLIHEQELLEAGDQLVENLAQHGAGTAGGRSNGVGRADAGDSVSARSVRQRLGPGREQVQTLRNHARLRVARHGMLTEVGIEQRAAEGP